MIRLSGTGFGFPVRIIDRQGAESVRETQMFFRQIVDSKLAQYAYLVGCQRTRQAVLIDPERDVDRYVAIARREGLRITAVTETHIHADFLSGCREFVDRYGCRAYLSAEGGPGWEYEWAEGRDRVTLLNDGDLFTVGEIDFQAVHTPGHTPEHMSFLITDRGAGAGEPMGMVSGDFVFVGDLGRPDLLETAAGHAGEMEPSARRLYASALGVFELPDYLRIWPGHGAGSACGKALGAVPDTTAGYEKRFSPALAAVRHGEDAFVSYILDGQPEPPQYFARMKIENRRGPALLGPLPRPGQLSGAELADVAADRRTVVVDTRGDRLGYYGGHIPGSIYAPLDKSFPTVTGSYIDPASPIALICNEVQVEEAVRDLVRIGLDHVTGWAPPEALEAFRAAGGKLASIEVIDFSEVGRRGPGPGVQVLDVRRATEFAEARVDGAANIAHTRLAGRLDELPRDKEVLVHCLTGARASAAASLLEREGFRVAAVNDIFTDAYRRG